MRSCGSWRRLQAGGGPPIIIARPCRGCMMPRGIRQARNRSLFPAAGQTVRRMALPLADLPRLAGLGDCRTPNWHRRPRPPGVRANRSWRRRPADHAGSDSRAITASDGTPGRFGQTVRSSRDPRGRVRDDGAPPVAGGGSAFTWPPAAWPAPPIARTVWIGRAWPAP